MKLQFLLISFVVCARSALARNVEENAGIKNPNLYQGDILLDPRQRLYLKFGFGLLGPGYRIRRGAIADTSRLWPGKILPYTIDSTLASDKDALDAISRAMDALKRHTCIIFKKRAKEPNYVNFVSGNGCKSYVGNIGRGRQNITLGRGCYYSTNGVFIGTVAHEIGHALGFEHEHSRPDRDRFITINYENIISTEKEWFERYNSSVINSLGVPYDYGSVMHYSRDAFSDNGRPTIVPRQRGVNNMGQRIGPSDRDIQQLNRLYKCPCGNDLWNCSFQKRMGWFSCSDRNKGLCKRTCNLC